MLSAVVVAMQLIEVFCKKLKYHRKITVVTNGTGSIDADDVSKITEKLREDNIDVTIL